jgi:hypothetical protein
MKKVGTKKRKMEVDKEEKQTVVDVNALVNKWMEAQKNICEVLLAMVNKIGELEKK